MKIPLVLLLLLSLIEPVKVVATLPTPSHVVIVLEENHDYTQIIGVAAAPYINSLVNDSNGALFTQSFALTHPSQPNYIMFFSGSNQGVINDNVPSTFPFTAANLGAALIDSGITFTGYSEGLPSVGYNGASSGAYARKHNPWVNWQETGTNGIPSSANQPLTSFPTDYSTLPVVSFVMPNQNNDMHNGTDPSRISTGDTWLNTHLNSYIQWAKTHNSLLILTFDEDAENGGNNKVATIFIGQMVHHGQYSETINHYSILRTLEDMYGVNHAGASATATPITDCWVTPASIVEQTTTPPTATTLSQNYPNPFNPTTAIGFSIPLEKGEKGGLVSLKIYNILGTEIATLVNENLKAGTYRVQWNASNVSSGMYFYKLTTNGFSETKKLVVMK